ncbi:transcription factor HBP-1b(c1)-like [Panicum miliaceum]|uniref:Transcription factor HBP-1b(C1)-like n=1 Tax=Panicum miliaceum TaxID=4540 RepID=A0A3L6SVA4_PANMI|nr:transcription factor HBP-1b(c1)-like [Panicum miliaceum]
MAYASPGTDTSTDPDTDEKNQLLELGQLASLTASGSGDKSKDKLGQKALRRLAQNREAARKSRLRKKAYVEQLENSRLKLAQLEQELQRARQQGIFIPTPGDKPHSTSENDCSGQMAVAIGKLGTLENFLQEADNLRLQTLQQMQRVLTPRQSARALLAISDYFSRLRALSSLWIARPRE